MHRLLPLALMFMAAVSFTACKKKPAHEVILIEEQEEVVDTSTVVTSSTSRTDTITWGGAKCTVTVARSIDKERPRVIEETDGRKYYDTRILVRVVNKEGKTFFERYFTKDDFLPHISQRWKKHGALLGLPFDRIDNGNLLFRGSVGSPDPVSDDIEPVKMLLNLSAQYQLSRDDEPSMYIPGLEDEADVDV